MNQPILCVGELLIDFFSTDRNTNLADSEAFMKRAGGAPANVCAAIAKLGGEAHFCGKVGNDAFGDYLQNSLEQANVNTTLLVKDSTLPTTLAFVSLQEDGQRDFIFNRGADANLSIEDVPLHTLDSMKIAHFGSATALLPGRLKDTYKSFIEAAKVKQSYISFDPNYRSDLWKGDEVEFIKLARDLIARCDFLKVSDEELLLLTGEPDITKAVFELHALGAECIAITLGKKGTFLSFKGETATIPSIPIHAVDTTGAGDAFVGATLYQLGKIAAPRSLSFGDWQNIVRFSNKVAAKVCEKVGAIEALPTLEEIQSI
ncbi:carbohydrate kinase family protein [Ureibacillus sinduriensis]|uniref:Sugar kinase n=1 Tax=Ureibacillus sinduriensis BLB-1 = JCM 15800 TaxID=1384057 RepID=A0A0A3HY36_9BACL|nr:carbohydrate kinase [Ureibacillus sinduriensis]KGR77344.1 sugar kinase [Ureibacillus sinduriensis BLB-1 = JCM 15800]